MEKVKTKQSMLKPLFSDEFNSVRIAAILDTHKDSEILKDFKELSDEDVALLKPNVIVAIPIAIRVLYGRSIAYYRTGKKSCPVQFDNLRLAKGNSDDAKLRKEVKFVFDKVVNSAKELIKKDQFNFDRLKMAVTGRTDQTFLAMWRDMIAKKKLKTSAAYQNAYNSFVRYAGTNIPFERITTQFIEKWVEKMKGNGLSGATIGMYLRAIRVPIRKCIAENLIKQIEFPFGRLSDDKVRIPIGRKRNLDFINIETINKIRAFEAPKKKDKDDAEEAKDSSKPWKDGYAIDVYRSIDMWVFSYLAGGINMADIVDLTYNTYYYNSGGNELQFIRKKTIDAADEELEVLIPITDDIRAILDRHSAKPTQGGRVFPFLLGENFDGSEAMKLRRIEQANQNIRKHLHKVCGELNLTQKVSPTWARHSFKTNATHSGIPTKYIEMAMGHSIGGKGVEGNYLGVFPIAQRLEYTRMLLTPEHTNLLNQLQELSKEELQTILKQL